MQMTSYVLESIDNYIKRIENYKLYNNDNDTEELEEYESEIKDKKNEMIKCMGVIKELNENIIYENNEIENKSEEVLDNLENIIELLSYYNISNYYISRVEKIYDIYYRHIRDKIKTYETVELGYEIINEIDEIFKDLDDTNISNDSELSMIRNEIDKFNDDIDTSLIEIGEQERLINLYNIELEDIILQIESCEEDIDILLK